MFIPKIRSVKVLFLTLILASIYVSKNICLADEKSFPQSLQEKHLTSDTPEKRKSNLGEIIKYPISFFDGFKLQLTYSQPKLTHVNHQIDFINDLAQTNLRDWDSEDIFTFDFVIWKDLSKYFKADFAIALSSGALETSNSAFRNTLNLSTRFRQRYDVLLLWSNLYYYPLTYNFKEHKPDRLIDPFIGGGIGCTFIREETSVKFRRRGFYNRVVTNFNEKNVGYKVLAGFDVNLGKVSKRMNKFGLTFTVLKIWNRMKGHSNVHLTEDLKIITPINLDLGYKEPMDIDLTGMNFSIAVSYKF